MFSIGDRAVIRPDSTQLREILMTSQERPCKRVGNQRTLMAMAACAMKEWLRPLQTMDRAVHSKDTALSMEKAKKLSIRSR